MARYMVLILIFMCIVFVYVVYTVIQEFLGLDNMAVLFVSGL